MKLLAEIKITAQLEIDNGEALILNHICSYDILDLFYEKCSHEFTTEQLKEKLSRLRCLTNQILEVHKTTQKAFGDVK